MRFLEFGDPTKPALLLIHGYGVSWRMWTRHIQSLESRYFVLAVVLPGFDQSDDADFVSVEQAADEIIAYIETEYDGKLFAICGSSLGGTIALDVLARNRLDVQKAIIDAGPVYPFSKLYIAFAVRVRLLQNRLIRRGRRVAIKPLEHSYMKGVADDVIRVCSRMSDETCRNVQVSSFSYRLPETIRETSTEITYWYGSKEAFLFKKTLDHIRTLVPQIQLEMLEGYDHGELCIGNPELFVERALVFLEAPGASFGSRRQT
jgi:pimeloyl-ACP methyl ester carboxylesterase